MAYFLSLCQDLVESSEQHYTDRSLSLSLNEIRTVYFFTFSRVAYFRWFVSWRGILSTSELLKMEDSLADFCSFVHVQSEQCVWPQAGSPACKCNLRPLPLFGSQNQIASLCLLHLCEPIKSRVTVPRPILSEEQTHGMGERFGGKKYVSNKCFIVWLQFSNPNPNKWLISKDSVNTAGSDKMPMYKTPMKNNFCL